MFVTFVSVSANAIDAINARGFFLKNTYSFWKYEKESLFLFPKRTTFFLIRRRLHCVIGSSLEHTVACGDVVERVKSINVQMSLIWSAVLVLYQARCGTRKVWILQGL